MRLFSNKSDALIKREKERAEAWVKGLDRPNQRALARKIMGLPPVDGEEAGADDEDEDEDKDDGKPWWHGANAAQENYDDPTFDLAKVRKTYQSYLQKVPTKPLRGPPQWDLTKWTKAQKAQFSLDGEEYFSD